MGLLSFSKEGTYSLFGKKMTAKALEGIAGSRHCSGWITVPLSSVTGCIFFNAAKCLRGSHPSSYAFLGMSLGAAYVGIPT